MDLFQPRSLQNGVVRHPFHNRCFILLASSLGSAVALTSAGSIFMHLGPRWTLQILQHQLKDPFIQNAPMNPNKEDSLVALLGYTFVRDSTSASTFHALILAIRDTFAWSFVVVFLFSILALVLSATMFAFKVWKGYFEWYDGAGLPEEWRVNRQPSQDVELVARGTNHAFEGDEVEQRGRAPAT
ncbi:hypothetical protein LTR84_011647 [Exophiala bonariae]|uniref:Uncharacterized protein n=1 Tax=Exophiala bonariae TaxID=1690606 RepID=A0AAV9NK93_9EURO|nr:hypothetical protein LTR84_011647 [Exophiala bonariae]